MVPSPTSMSFSAAEGMMIAMQARNSSAPQVLLPISLKV